MRVLLLSQELEYLLAFGVGGFLAGLNVPFIAILFKFHGQFQSIQIGSLLSNDQGRLALVREDL